MKVGTAAKWACLLYAAGAGLTTLALVGLKPAGAVPWDWRLVFLPVWGPFAVAGVAAACAVAAAFVAFCVLVVWNSF